MSSLSRMPLKFTDLPRGYGYWFIKSKDNAGEIRARPLTKRNLEGLISSLGGDARVAHLFYSMSPRSIYEVMYNHYHRHAAHVQRIICTTEPQIYLLKCCRDRASQEYFTRNSVLWKTLSRPFAGRSKISVVRETVCHPLVDPYLVCTLFANCARLRPKSGKYSVVPSCPERPTSIEMENSDSGLVSNGIAAWFAHDLKIIGAADRVTVVDASPLPDSGLAEVRELVAEAGVDAGDITVVRCSSQVVFEVPDGVRVHDIASGTELQASVFLAAKPCKLVVVVGADRLDLRTLAAVLSMGGPDANYIVHIRHDVYPTSGRGAENARPLLYKKKVVHANDSLLDPSPLWRMVLAGEIGDRNPDVPVLVHKDTTGRVPEGRLETELRSSVDFARAVSCVSHRLVLCNDNIDLLEPSDILSYTQSWPCSRH